MSWTNEDDDCCGSCVWHKPDSEFDDAFVCVNPDSDLYSDWTNYEDWCVDYTPKED